MASVVTRIEDAAYGPVPARAGVAASGEVATRPVMAGEDRPLLMWAHTLAPGASLEWNGPAQDHLVYVWEGAVTADRQTLTVDEAFVVEHGGHGVVQAGETPATVLHFHRPEDHAAAAGREGGHTHVLAGARVMRGVEAKSAVGRALYADAACPTCEVWLHGNQLPPGLKVERHYHTEDEIIVVTAGEIKLGRLGYGRGSVLAVDAETRYGFTSGDPGLSFINYRPAPPVYVIGDDSRPPQDERALLLRGLARSQPAPVA